MVYELLAALPQETACNDCKNDEEMKKNCKTCNGYGIFFLTLDGKKLIIQNVCPIKEGDIERIMNEE